MGKGARMVVESGGGVEQLQRPTTKLSDAELDSLIDMRQPLVWQVITKAASGELTNEMYSQWVHRPHYYSSHPKHMHFFHNPILEAGSKTSWYIIPLFWTPVILAMVYYFGLGLTTATAVSYFGAGVVYWTLLEYVLHRFVFHMDTWVPNHPAGIIAHFVLHGCHHKVPNDRYRLVFPPAAAILLALPVFSISRALLYVFIPDAQLFGMFMTGVILGYMCYDLIHYGTHHGNWSRTSFMGRIRSYHLAHHYATSFDKGFGISSTFWDHVFGTVLYKQQAE